MRNGFRGPIYCTRASKQLARLLLMDSAKIQEEDARYANKKGYSKHKPALPLYDEKDAKRALKQFNAVDFHEWIDLSRGARARFQPAGHILGAASLEVQIPARRSRAHRRLLRRHRPLRHAAAHRP